VDSTRDQLLAHIVDHGGATVADLCESLGLADATVRRHLDRLQIDGLLTMRDVRQATGRPYRMYEATAVGVTRERDHSAELATRLLGQMKQGHSDVDDVARGLADAIVAEHRNEVSARDMPARIAETVAVLKTEGILDGWESTEQGFLLLNHACPYLSAADTSDCVCESDRLAIEELVGAAVQQVGSVVQGDGVCEYIVMMPESSGPEISGPDSAATKTDPNTRENSRDEKG